MHTLQALRQHHGGQFAGRGAPARNRHPGVSRGRLGRGGQGAEDAGGQEAGPHRVPDLIYGWDPDPARRKPSPYPVEQILQALELQPGQVLVVDDLKPGVLMAQAAGVAVAAAGWAHAIPAIRSYMEANCLAYFERVAEFAQFILA